MYNFLRQVLDSERVQDFKLEPGVPGNTMLTTY